MKEKGRYWFLKELAFGSTKSRQRKETAVIIIGEKQRSLTTTLYFLLLFLIVLPYCLFAQENLLLKDIKIDSVTASTDVTITIDPKGYWNIEGKRGTIPAPDNPKERIVVENIMHNGAIHHFKGRVEGRDLEQIIHLKVGFDGYVFEGDEDNPLTFKCVYKTGYTYSGGKGKVTMKDGKQITLGYQQGQQNRK
jgi:hypothetical protein